MIIFQCRIKPVSQALPTWRANQVILPAHGATVVISQMFLSSVCLELVHTSDRRDRSRVVSRVGVGRKFWSSVNRYDGSDGSGSGIGRKRNSSHPCDFDSVELATPLPIWFTLDRNTPCASDSDSVSDSVASLNQPLWSSVCKIGDLIGFWVRTELVHIFSYCSSLVDHRDNNVYCCFFFQQPCNPINSLSLSPSMSLSLLLLFFQGTWRTSTNNI